MEARIRASDEAGFTMVELMAALGVLAIGFFALAGAMGLGLRQVTLGRQRQTATEIGNARVEHLRNVPYEAVALTTQPLHVTDQNSPDYFVSADHTQFDVTGSGDYEDLIVDETGGQVLHLEDPVAVGETTMEVWQYATWADQANNVKRLTAVVVYKPQVLGASRMVRVSTLFTPGTVTIEGSNAGASQGSGGSGPTPTPTPSASCAGDTSAPTGSFTILSGAGQSGFTASREIQITMSLSDPCAPIQIRFTNTQGVTWGGWNNYNATNPSAGWVLSDGDGQKDVDAEVRDGLGNVRSLATPDIILDTVKPTVPGTLAKSVSCSGLNRTVNLSWGTSTDAHFQGYRVYVSVNSGTWTTLSTTSGLTHVHTHDKTLDSVRYHVVGYDKAGNQSDETNVVSLSKNRCS